jgi:hypothetical protein
MIMAKVKWAAAEPAPDPFAAVVGDSRLYAVRVCTVSEASEPEIQDVFVEFFRQVFDSAVAVENEEARKILIEVDTVYAMMTVVVTDDERSYDEHKVYKLGVTDWDIGVGDDEDEEADDEAGFKRVFENFEKATRAALKDFRLAALQAELGSRGFRLWITEYSEGEEKPQEQLPLSGSETKTTAKAKGRRKKNASPEGQLVVKKINHIMRMGATGSDGREYGIDVFEDWEISKDAKKKDVVKSGPAYYKTEDGLEVVQTGDGKYQVVATGVELTLKGPLFVTPISRLIDGW